MKLYKRLFSVFLTLFLVLGMVPIQTFASTTYELYVGGFQVTSNNAQNITGDTITGTVYYSTATNTLYLTNATITAGMAEAGNENVFGICSYIPGLTIAFNGENSVSGLDISDNKYGKAIVGVGGLTLRGANSATLTATGAYGIENADSGTLTFNGGTVSAKGDGIPVAYGIYCNGGILLQNGVSIDTTGKTSAITADNNPLTAEHYTVTGSADEDASSLTAAYLVSANGDGTVSMEPNSTTPAKTAKLVPSTYSLTYDANGGTGTAPTDLTQYQGGASTTVKQGDHLTKEGKLFSHWNTKADGYGTSYAPGNSCTVTQNITLYAQYITGITVTYDANTGSDPPDASDPFVPGSSLILDDGATLTPPGIKIFSHWNTKADGSGTDYQGGESYRFDSDTILYALYRDNVSPIPCSCTTLCTEENRSDSCLVCSNTSFLSCEGLPQITGLRVSWVDTDTDPKAAVTFSFPENAIGYTWYYAVTQMADGSASAEEILDPPSYSAKIVTSGSGAAEASNSFAIPMLDPSQSYYFNILIANADRSKYTSPQVELLDAPDPLTMIPSGGRYDEETNTLTLTGGGTVTFTLNYAAPVFCTDESITVTGSGMTYSALLPNVEALYLFEAENPLGSAFCKVQVVQTFTPQNQHLCLYLLKHNSSSHWYGCTCGKYFGMEEHYSTSPATYGSPELCAVCKYQMSPKLSPVKKSTLTIDYLNKLPGGVDLGLENLTVELENGTEVDLSVYSPAIMQFTHNGKTYYFSGFSKSSPLKIGKDVTVYANYSTAKYYTVTFDPAGGSVNKKQDRIKEGASLAAAVKKVKPEKEGYHFIGWKTADGETVSGTANADITVYADWEQLIKVTAEPNNGKEPTVQYVQKGKKVIGSQLSKPEREGYRFTGWYTDQSCSILYNFDHKLSRDMTLYAGWEDNGTKQTILTVDYMTYMPKNAKTDIPVKQIPVQKGCKVDLSAYYPNTMSYTVEDVTYSFTGFYQLSSNTVTMDQSKTVYAFWESEKAYTLTLDPAGGDVTPLSARVTSGSKVETVLRSAIPTNGNNIFVGWIRSDGKAIDAEPYGDLTATAVWKKDRQHVITVDPDNGKAPQYVIAEEGSTVPEPEQPTKSGYAFHNWNSDPRGFKFDQTKVRKDYTLTAQWERVYTVTFRPNNDEDPTTVTIKNKEKLQKPADPTRNGYRFTGWYTDVDCTTSYDFDQTVQTSFTLYAGWVNTTIPVSIDGDQIHIPVESIDLTEGLRVLRGDRDAQYKGDLILGSEESPLTHGVLLSDTNIRSVNTLQLTYDHGIGVTLDKTAVENLKTDMKAQNSTDVFVHTTRSLHDQWPIMVDFSQGGDHPGDARMDFDLGKVAPLYFAMKEEDPGLYLLEIYDIRVGLIGADDPFTDYTLRGELAYAVDLSGTSQQNPNGYVTFKADHDTDHLFVPKVHEVLPTQNGHRIITRSDSNSTYIIAYAPQKGSMDNFATTVGEFDDLRYYGRAARENDLLTVKVSLSAFGEMYGLTLNDFTVRFETEGAVQCKENYFCTGSEIYKDGIAADFSLAKGFNQITAVIYDSKGNKLGAFKPVYTNID